MPIDFRAALRAAVVLAAIGLALLVVLGLTLAHAESGIASVYSTHDRDQNGTTTASGVPLNDGALTAAHRTLAFGTHVRVTNRQNGRSVTVVITDRGPFVRGRIIDLTVAAARQLGFCCLAPVTVERE